MFPSVGPAQERLYFTGVHGNCGINVVVNRYSDYTESSYHDHDFLEIAYVQSGRGWHVLDKQIMLCEPGDMYVISPGDAHMFMAELGTPLTICNLLFHGEFFDPTLRGRDDLGDFIRRQLRSFRSEDFPRSIAIHFTGHERQEIVSLYERMLMEYNERQIGFEELLKAWATELLVKVLRKAGGAAPERAPELRLETLNSVYDYIQSHYTETIRLEDLAAMAFLSPKYFSRLFKACTGQTVTEYTRKLRIAHACELLSGTNFSMQQVASESGYSDTKYFTKQFHREKNMSPSEYRRREQGNYSQDLGPKANAL